MIRRATRADAPDLLQLIAEFYAVDGHPYDEGTVRSGLLPLLDSDDHGVVLVGDGSYAVVAWSYSLESGGRDALLDEIYVRTRGEGAGSALLERVFDEVTSRGMNRVFLETEPGNERARSFYERHGFEVEDSIWMSLDLGSSR